MNWQPIKKFGSWTWKIVVAIGVILGIIGFYYQFLQPANVLAQVISEINVLDVREPLRDLQIFFQGNNIQQENLNLRVYRIRVENNGGMNITQNDFDQNGDWGVKIENGRIMETRLIESNSDYVKENLLPQIQNDTTVKFNKIIFDKTNYFIIEFLILHNKDKTPTLYRFGKIAGIQENEVKISDFQYNEPFWATMFYGSWKINLVRFGIYFVFSVALFIALAFYLVKWQEKRTKEKQSPQVQQPN